MLIAARQSKWVEMMKASHMWRRIRLMLPLLVLTCANGCGQEPASTESVPKSSLSNDHTILYDFAHNNVDDPVTFDLLSKWLGPYGYKVRKNDGSFDEEKLGLVDILVIKNAIADANKERWSLPTPSAFTLTELDVLNQWVRDGGSLVIVADHMPIAGAAKDLLSRFGVETSNGFAVNAKALDGYEPSDVMEAAYLRFRRDDGSIIRHAINDGGLRSQRIDLLTTHVGSAFRLPEQGEPLLKLGSDTISLIPEVSWEFNEATPRIDVTGWLQAGVIRIGRGRVAVLGDSQLLAVPWPESPTGEPETYGAAEDNMYFTLNLFYWLSGRL